MEKSYGFDESKEGLIKALMDNLKRYGAPLYEEASGCGRLWKPLTRVSLEQCEKLFFTVRADGGIHCDPDLRRLVINDSLRLVIDPANAQRMLVLNSSSKWAYGLTFKELVEIHTQVLEEYKKYVEETERIYDECM